MRPRALLVPLLLAAVACGRPDEPASPRRVRMPPAPTTSHPEIDADNLLNLAYGASVISRTAEATLEQSAVHAIDGISETGWWSPPGGQPQELVFSLPAPVVVERVGITSSANPPSEVRFDTSPDGDTWSELATMSPDKVSTPQLVDIAPTTVRFVRLHAIDTTQYYVSLRSVHLVGRKSAPITPQSLDGCWTINGAPAFFVSEGPRLRGRIEDESHTLIDGAFDGSVARVMWSRGPMFGYAAVTPGAGGTTLSGLTFHEEMVIDYAGAAWFGSRREPDDRCGATEGRAPHEEILDRAGRWSMFGLVFSEDGRLDTTGSAATLEALIRLLRRDPPQKVRIVAHEFRLPTGEENRRRASMQIEQIRSALKSRGTDLSGVDFVAAGSDRPPAPITSAVQRLLASRVDFEAAR